MLTWRGTRFVAEPSPPNIVQTESRPDLVLVDSLQRTVWLLELTCSFESNFESANKRKTERYACLAADIEALDYQCNNLPFEIGSRGYINMKNKSTLTALHQLWQPKTRLRHFLHNISKTSLLYSYSIYLSRNDRDWTSAELL